MGKIRRGVGWIRRKEAVGRESNLALITEALRGLTAWVCSMMSTEWSRRIGRLKCNRPAVRIIVLLSYLLLRPIIYYYHAGWTGFSMFVPAARPLVSWLQVFGDSACEFSSHCRGGCHTYWAFRLLRPMHRMICTE